MDLLEISQQQKNCKCDHYISVSVTNVLQIYLFYQINMEFFAAGNFTFCQLWFGHKFIWIWQLHFLQSHTDEPK